MPNFNPHIFLSMVKHDLDPLGDAGREGVKAAGLLLVNVVGRFILGSAAASKQPICCKDIIAAYVAKINSDFIFIRLYLSLQ
jgi:hypothetical protein